MLIVLDFDDVLFDAANFKKTLAKIFDKHGANFWTTYEQAKKPDNLYSLKKHFALIEKVDIKKIEKDINKINFKQFLFPDVLKFLKTFRNHDLVLLTWGDKNFQRRKIAGLGSEFISFFSRIIAGPVEKIEILAKLIRVYKSRPVIFIDNNPQELEKIRKKFKDVILIKMDRNKGGSLFRIWRGKKINQ